ncbi:MAG: hypothetical protein ACRCVV_09265 [Shewanella sp.]
MVALASFYSIAAPTAVKLKPAFTVHDSSGNVMKPSYNLKVGDYLVLIPRSSSVECELDFSISSNNPELLVKETEEGLMVARAVTEIMDSAEVTITAYSKALGTSSKKSTYITSEDKVNAGLTPSFAIKDTEGNSLLPSYKMKVGDAIAFIPYSDSDTSDLIFNVESSSDGLEAIKVDNNFLIVKSLKETDNATVKFIATSESLGTEGVKETSISSTNKVNASLLPDFYILDVYGNPLLDNYNLKVGEKIILIPHASSDSDLLEFNISSSSSEIEVVKTADNFLIIKSTAECSDVVVSFSATSSSLGTTSFKKSIITSDSK